MKRWAAPFLLTVLTALPILFLHPERTNGIVYKAILNPKWSLSFAFPPEAGALAAVGCVLGLFWFLRELTERPGLALGGAGLFASAHWLPLDRVSPLLFGLGTTTLAAGLLRRPPQAALSTILAAAALGGVAFETQAFAPLGGTPMLLKPDGALTLASILLVLSAYARFERQGRALPVPITPGTPPATRTASLQPERSQRAAWLVVSMASAALTMVAFPESRALPAMLVVVALVMVRQGRTPIWKWHLGFWGALVISLFFGTAPISPRWPGIELGTAVALLVPSLSPYLLVSEGFSLRTIAVGSILPFRLLAGSAAYVEARTEATFAVAGFALAALALFPGAVREALLPNLYASFAFRSLFVAALGAAALRGAATAWCPPGRPAPPRPRPAPGSLPRP